MLLFYTIYYKVNVRILNLGLNLNFGDLKFKRFWRSQNKCVIRLANIVLDEGDLDQQAVPSPSSSLDQSSIDQISIDQMSVDQKVCGLHTVCPARDQLGGIQPQLI